MKRASLAITVCATLAALTFGLSFLPFVFLVPTLFAACCFGYGISFFASTAFGVISMCLAFMFPSGNMFGAVGIYFINYPFIPIVARMFLGPIARTVYLLVLKLFKNKNAAAKIIPVSVAAAVGSLLNTVFVGLFIILLPAPELKGLADITIGFLAIWGSLEIAVTAVILPPMVLAIKRAMPKLIKELNTKPKK